MGETDVDVRTSQNDLRRHAPNEKNPRFFMDSWLGGGIPLIYGCLTQRFETPLLYFRLFPDTAFVFDGAYIHDSASQARTRTSRRKLNRVNDSVDDKCCTFA